LRRLLKTERCRFSEERMARLFFSPVFRLLTLSSSHDLVRVGFHHVSERLGNGSALLVAWKWATGSSQLPVVLYTGFKPHRLAQGTI
jgi:hypothetical protein